MFFFLIVVKLEKLEKIVTEEITNSHSSCDIYILCRWCEAIIVSAMSY